MCPAENFLTVADAGILARWQSCREFQGLSAQPISGPTTLSRVVCELEAKQRSCAQAKIKQQRPTLVNVIVSK